MLAGFRSRGSYGRERDGRRRGRASMAKVEGLVMGHDEMPDEGFFVSGEAPPAANDAALATPPRLAGGLGPSIVRVKRRCDGTEKPIPLPWPSLNDHFGGGLWPGLHYVNGGTGIGKTQWGMEAGAHAAKADIPTLYVGLELGELDLALRVMGTVAGVKWSHMWTGVAGPSVVHAAEQTIPTISAWPFHYEIARPHGMPASAIRDAIGGMRATYPETDGPGS